jgi:hypothetical protein
MSYELGLFQFCSLTWFCIRSLTRSIGAAAVFEIPAAIPPTVLFQIECAISLYKYISVHMRTQEIHDKSLQQN